MLLFWIIISFMLLLCLAFVVVPLLRQPSMQSWLSMGAVLVFVPALAFLLYYEWGDSQGVAQYIALQKDKGAIQHAVAQYTKHPQQLVKRMQAALQRRPKSAKGWFLLGRLYMGLGQYSKAVTALAKANRLKPSDPETVLQYAQALFLANKHTLDHTAKTLLNQVMQKYPHNPRALNLLALDAYTRQHYQQAINYWEAALQQFPPKSADSQVLLKAIAAAQKKLAEAAG